MPLEPDTRACLTCETMLRGRIDKKFCDDYCRSAYNNRQYQENRGLSFIRKVNNILRKNRRILEELAPPGEDTFTIPRARMVKKGFNFNYLTCMQAREGVLYHFCYEYGYIPFGKDHYYVIKKMELTR
jgi:hypothetical protein